MLNYKDELVIAIYRQEREAEAAQERLLKQIQPQTISKSWVERLQAIVTRASVAKSVPADVKHTTATMRVVTQE